MTYILAIDQGTTSSRALLFDGAGKPVCSHSVPVRQLYPHAGWVEHDGEDIWQGVLACCRAVLEQVDTGKVKAIGITNQRETTLVWNRMTGKPVHNAIVWQDSRTAGLCQELQQDSELASHITRTTGLRPDPYFSATKLHFILENPGVRRQAETGALCFGTIDSWLLFRLTGGRIHATDATNASRTMLYDIEKGVWDERLLQRLDIPAPLLPEVRDCQYDFGLTDMEVLGHEIPVCGMAGDQHAATYGQGCLEPGMGKATFGTGCFMMVNTGDTLARSGNRMLTTPAWQLDGKTAWALEGSVFMAGATVQWLRDSLGLVASAAETEVLAQKADPGSGVFLVPAFQGLGAPYWDAGARATITGMSRAAGRAEIVRAGLESVAFQTCDLVQALSADMERAGLGGLSVLRVDGGMTGNGWFMQFLADILDMPVDIAAVAETTALGAAFHAGQYCGVYGDSRALADMVHYRERLHPAMDSDRRTRLLDGWSGAVRRTLTGKG